LLSFPDEVVLYPTHGAGSFCAAPTSLERISTIGHERLGNSLAQAADEDSFVIRSLSGLPSYPTYFKYLRSINQRGPALLGGVPALKPLNPEEVLRLGSQGVAILDTRPPKAFAAGHIPGSYGIPLGAPLITWAGWVIPFGSPLVLVGSDARELDQAVRQLIRIGYDDLRRTLAGGFEAWEAEGRPVTRLPVMPVQELAERLERGVAPLILDVRSDAEWRAGHLPEAIHVEAGRLSSEDLPLPKDDLKVVHCGHSDRSTVGISVLERRGYRNLVLLDGGFSSWLASGYEVVSEA
ncbi:MAG TPA: rhodanese-like domain-containing protein, partial [Anaerolineales bacterium]|nr:rhodanese-like domain-containing protein [Anaerolineales bacterium]